MRRRGAEAMALCGYFEPPGQSPGVKGLWEQRVTVLNVLHSIIENKST